MCRIGERKKGWGGVNVSNIIPALVIKMNWLKKLFYKLYWRRIGERERGAGGLYQNISKVLFNMSNNIDFSFSIEITCIKIFRKYFFLRRITSKFAFLSKFDVFESKIGVE